jgi:hypothetical protein
LNDAKKKEGKKGGRVLPVGRKGAAVDRLGVPFQQMPQLELVQELLYYAQQGQIQRHQTLPDVR